MDEPGGGTGYVGGSDTPQFISFNGVDVSVDDLFGKGVMMNASKDDQFQTDDLDEDDLDEIFGCDDTEVREFEQTESGGYKRKESLATILETQPPSLETMLEDESFHKVTEDGFVKKKILQSGAGRKVVPASRVYFHYAAFHNDCAQPFDSTVSRRACSVDLEPPGAVIRGLRLALQTMDVLEIAQILIHYTYGFLELGCPPRVPGSANLVYNVKMLSFTPLEKLTISQLSFEDRARLPFSEVLEAAKNIRRNANGMLQAKNVRAAIRNYRNAVDIMDEYSTSNENDNKQRCEFLTTLYANIATAYLRINSPEPCCVACKRGLEFQYVPMNGTFLRSFARAKSMLHAYPDALGLVARARKYGKKEMCDFLEKEIREKMAQERKNEALLAKSMLGLSTKDLTPTDK